MESVNPRPKGLFILLLLTFFNTGSSIFFGLLTVLFLRPTEVELKKEKLEMAKSIIEIKELGMDSLATLLEKVQGMTDVLNHHFLGVNLVNIGVCLLGGVSAFFMLQRNHLGFHGYIIYNLLASINVYFFCITINGSNSYSNCKPPSFAGFYFTICKTFTLDEG